MNHFLDCVFEDRQPACDGTQGVRNLFLLETAYFSARTGESILTIMSEPTSEA